jgi:glycosyltransferase involved in cell wall biosynthesis
MQYLKDQPLVSVVVASYNMGAYLPLAVSSILSSTYANIEVIVIDDGSSDDTAERIKPCLVDPRVNYVRQENQGQPKAKNKGLRIAKGEFIAFCDADDLWEPSKLERQMPRFANPNVGVVYSEVSFIDDAGTPYEKPPVYRRYIGEVTDQLLLKNFVPFGTAVIRRQCVEKNGLFDEQFRMGIDWDLWLRYSLEWEFDYIPDRTYIYREWSGQMSNNYRGRYEFASKILSNFEANYRDKLNGNALKKAWADIYICRADIFAKAEKTFWQPLNDVLKGLSLDPASTEGWKTLLKILIRWY